MHPHLIAAVAHHAPAHGHTAGYWLVGFLVALAFGLFVAVASKVRQISD